MSLPIYLLCCVVRNLSDMASNFHQILDRRCLKCKNVYSNINATRTPFLYPNEETKEEELVTVKDMLLPKMSTIRECILKRVESLEPNQLPMDPGLILVSKVMKAMGVSEIKFDQGILEKKRNLFALCEDCGIHSFKKETNNKSFACYGCQRKRESQKRLRDRAEKNKEDR